MTKLTIEALFNMAKENFLENGEEDVIFILDSGEEGSDLTGITLEEENNSMALKLLALSELVKEAKCERYFVVFTGYAVNKAEIGSHLMKVFKEEVSDESSFKEFLEYSLRLHSASPSQSPLKRKIFNVVSCDKHNGTDSIGEYYDVVDDRIVFSGKQEVLGKGDQLFVGFNIWQQLQISIGDEDARTS